MGDRKIYAVEAVFDYMRVTCAVLHQELFYNCLMVCYPKLIIKFPYKVDDYTFNLETKPFKEDLELRSVLKQLRITKDQMFESIIILEKKIFDKDEIVDIKKGLKKQADDLLKYHDRFEEIDIQDKKSFFKINGYFFMMECIFNKITAEVKKKNNWEAIAAMDLENEQAKNLCSCIFQSQDLTIKYSELLNYWIGQIIKYGKNPGAEAMKKIAKDNRIVIENVLSNLQICATNIFRKDKRLRETFVAMVKEKSGITSEDRIFKIARSILAVKAVLPGKSLP